MNFLERKETILWEWKKISSVKKAKEAIETGKISKEFAEELIQLLVEDKKKKKARTRKEKILHRIESFQKQFDKKNPEELDWEKVVITKKEIKHLEKALEEIEKSKEIGVGSEEQDIDPDIENEEK